MKGNRMKTITIPEYIARAYYEWASPSPRAAYNTPGKALYDAIGAALRVPPPEPDVEALITDHGGNVWQYNALAGGNDRPWTRYQPDGTLRHLPWSELHRIYGDGLTIYMPTETP